MLYKEKEEYVEDLSEQFDVDAIMDLFATTARIQEQEKEDRAFMNGRCKGKNEGLIEGHKKGRLSMCIELINDGILTIEQASKKLNIPIGEINKLIHN